MPVTPRQRMINQVSGSPVSSWLGGLPPTAALAGVGFDIVEAR